VTHRQPLIPLLLLTLLLGACGPQAPSGEAGEKAKKPVHLVETLTVQPDALNATQERTATLTAERLLKVTAREEGIVLSLAGQPGEAVAQGGLLVRQDDALLRNELARAEAALREAEQNLKRSRHLREAKSVSEEALLAAVTAADVARAEVDGLRLRVGYMSLTAPFAGVIAERLVEPGEAVAARQHLLTLIDPSRLVARVTLAEQLLAQLAVGDLAELRIDALGEGVYPGHIARIFPQVDPTTRQGTLDVALDPIPAAARPGQLVRVRLTPKSEARLWVPFAALRSDAAGEYLFLYQGGKAVRRAVRSGEAVGLKVSILDGLQAGDQVIVRGLLDLRDGKAVTLPGESPEGGRPAKAAPAAQGSAQ